MAWGSILQGIGSVLGAGAGIAGAFGGEEDNYHPEVWRNQATHDRMRMARDMDIISKEYGIHPLVLYGQGFPSQGSPVQVAGGGDRWIGDVAGNIGRAFQDIGALYESDTDRRERERDRLDRMDEAARGRMERRIDRAFEEKMQAKRDQVTDAEVRRLDSETMLNAARTRTELQQLRQATMGAVGSGAPSQPGEVRLPYTGIWRLKRGTSSSSDVQNLMGEPFEWLSALEHGIWNYLNPDPREIYVPGPEVPKIGPYGNPYWE